MFVQYFHEVAETEPWMLNDMNTLATCLDKISMQTISDEEEKTVENQLQVSSGIPLSCVKYSMLLLLLFVRYLYQY